MDKVNRTNRIKTFLKNEIVLVISFILAVVSVFFVPPSAAYADYIDFRTLALLLCLMAVMKGFDSLGVFRLLAEKLLQRVHTLRGLGITLCLLCFFSSMVITNDVALITFVPFSIVALQLSGSNKGLIPLVALETIAANLGSMLTPIGNPQNLYLFSNYNMSMADFFSTVWPYALLSLVLVVICALCLGRQPVQLQVSGGGAPATESMAAETVATTAASAGCFKADGKRFIMYILLFLLALLTVFRVLPYPVTLVVTVLAILILDRKILAKVDYSLLFTFIFLFIFIGNLGNIAPISEFLQKIVVGNEVLAGILSSQAFSNVPAAILLSGFTQNASALLIGVNLGGLGTLIASMASLISFKFLAKEKIRTGQYLLVFTLLNLLFLGANVVLAVVVAP